MPIYVFHDSEQKVKSETRIKPRRRIKGGGGGVQAYNLGNFDYEIRVEGEGTILPM